MKSRLIFLLLTWLMLSPPGKAPAYFQVPDANAPLSQTPPSDGGSGRVVLLGNQNKSGAAPQVRPWSDRFSPLDVIPVNQPLSIVLKKPIRPEGNLADMLYANVKLNALMDQYEALQRRSAELLEGLSVPGIDDAGMKKSSGAGSPSLQHSVATQRAELEQSHRAVGQNYGTRAGEHLTGREAGPGQMQSPSPLMDRLSEAEETSLKTTGGASETSAHDPRPLAGRTSDTSLPWIFEVALKLIRYFFSHKVEAIILGAVGLSVVMILSSLRRSR